MTEQRRIMVDKLWRGSDPFLGVARRLYQTDLQGWGETHHYLPDTIVELRPQVVIELGVWKGASTLVMAAKLRELGVDGVVIAVDTWLGSSEHWLDDTWFLDLGMEAGRPKLQHKFMANVLSLSLEDYVVPLPMDSLNAAHVLAARHITADVLHLDSGHDYASVTADLHAWWPLIRTGGVLIGDDYNTNDVWPDVRRAFDEFLSEQSFSRLEIEPPKIRIWK